MKVELLAAPADPIDVMWVAAKTCYSATSPIDLWHKERYRYIDAFVQDTYKSSQDKMWKLVGSVLESGHTSIAEHVSFTFAVEGISRACSHQLVRHRLCTYSQQSQRYVEIKEDIGELCHLLLELQRDAKDKLDKTVATFEKTEELLNKYFVMETVIPETMEAYLNDLITYKRYIEMGYKAEQARAVLPNATKTNIVVTTNLRNLIHISELRLCTRAQKEIRTLFKEIKKLVVERDDRLGNLLLCQCDKLGYCPEASKCCGRKPTLKERNK